METSTMRLCEDLAPVGLASTIPVQSMSYLIHEHKENIEGFVSEEEEREICDTPSRPLSSSLMPYLSLMDDLLAELNILNAQLAVRKMRTLANLLNLKRTLDLSYKPYNRFCALSKSQHFLVHLTHASNMRLIWISILKSIMKCDNSVKGCVSVDVCGSTKEAIASIPQVSSGELCETLIQLLPKRDSVCQMKSIELKSVPASFDDSSSGSDLKALDSICPSLAPNYITYEYDFESPVDIWKN